jgi:hypothetical protein
MHRLLAQSQNSWTTKKEIIIFKAEKESNGGQLWEERV